MSSISRSVARDDAPRKTSGTAPYLADLPINGALHAALLLSTRPHARLLAVELPELPHGYTRIDSRDVPGRNAVAMINESWPLFPEDRVCHVGQPIVVVTGPDRAVLADVIDAARVEYEDLQPVTRIDDAKTFVDYDLRGAPGPPAAAGPTADAASLTETFETGLQEHVYLEPQAMAAWVEDGRIVVCGSMQCPYYVKHAVEIILGLAPDRVRVVQSTTGGAFGGKEEYPSFLAGLVAVAAWKTGAPVRLVLDRSVDMRMSTKRHPSRITLASRLTSGRRLLGSSIDVRTDAGAFEGLSAVVLQRAMFAASGVYRIPEVLVRGRAHRTNVVPSGAFRGFGSPQAFFAIEMHMCHLARAAEEDPADFKRRHLLRQGDRTVTGGILRDRLVVEEMLDDVLERSGYREKRRRNERGKGVGLSIFSHGCGFTGSGERDIIKARARVRLLPEGTVEILCSNVEMGQGAETTLRKIVADTLEIDLDRVTFAAADTDRVPDSGPTVASRTVMVVGGLLERAARRLAEARGTGALPGEPVTDGPVEIEEVYRQPQEVEWDQETFTGDAYAAFSWGVNVVEIEVDPLTFEIRPLSVWAAYDVGIPIDERIVTGQAHGGIVQGIGYATGEVLEVKDGALRQATLTDYTIPGPLDVPHIDVRFFENPYGEGPFGAKGAGEIPFTGAAPAVADAVECALGVTINTIPITPEYLERVCR